MFTGEGEQGSQPITAARCPLLNRHDSYLATLVTNSTRGTCHCVRSCKLRKLVSVGCGARGRVCGPVYPPLPGPWFGRAVGECGRSWRSGRLLNIAHIPETETTLKTKPRSIYPCSTLQLPPLCGGERPLQRGQPAPLAFTDHVSPEAATRALGPSCHLPARTRAVTPLKVAVGMGPGVIGS